MSKTGDTAELKADTSVMKALRTLRLPQTQRNRELGLLLLAFAISGSAVALVQLGALGGIEWTILYYVGALAVLVLGLHIVLRMRAPNADPFVVPIATTLTGLGIAMIYRIDLSGDEVGWDAASTRQIAWTAIAVVGAIALVLLLRNYRLLFRYTYISGFVGLVLLLLPVIPGLAAEGTGAAVWVSIGGLFTFQPAELAKIALAIFFAGYLVRTRESLTSTGHRFLGMTWPRAREIGPLLIIWAVSLAIIVLQRDLGTGVLIFGMFIAMLYTATGRTSWVVIGLGLAGAGVFIASQVMTYVGSRISAWWHAFDPEVMERTAGSYQLVQGIFGLAQGGLIGTGLGQGRPYLTPLSQSDYILPSLGEEIGLVGIFAILCLYMVFISRGIRIGLAGQDDFGKLLATGLAFTIALQVFIMVGGVTRLIPLTGLTTPFLAAGGSSLVANWLIVGLLLRVSDAVRSRPRVVIG
ncbi:MAG TPA: cell division protein FtsW [Microbacterium sp.]|nr:cell division protein FtsW [Microbacterium sp.]